jgi:hypothetical protein
MVLPREPVYICGTTEAGIARAVGATSAVVTLMVVVAVAVRAGF